MSNFLGVVFMGAVVLVPLWWLTKWMAYGGRLPQKPLTRADRQERIEQAKRDRDMAEYNSRHAYVSSSKFGEEVEL